MTNLQFLRSKWLPIALPPLALILCGSIVLPKQRSLAALNKEAKAAQDQQTMLEKTIEALRATPVNPRIASLPYTKEEQSDFLRGLSELCSRSGNKMISLISLAAPKPNPEQAAAEAAKPKTEAVSYSLPPDVQEIKSTIIYEGSFQSSRYFMTGLQNTKRLISLGECHIGPSSTGFPNISTTLTISRYVDEPIMANSMASSDPSKR